MSGMLLAALQFYTRTRAQRWLFAGALVLWTAQLVMTRAACPCPRSFTPWPFILGGLTAAAAAVMLILGAWDFRRISALRTVYLIPYSRLRGSPRGTFEMLFGCVLFCVVLVQVITGPSRVLSVASLALVTPLVLRPDLFMKPDLIGLPKAHVLAGARSRAGPGVATDCDRGLLVGPTVAAAGLPATAHRVGALSLLEHGHDGGNQPADSSPSSFPRQLPGGHHHPSVRARRRRQHRCRLRRARVSPVVAAQRRIAVRRG